MPINVSPSFQPLVMSCFDHLKWIISEPALKKLIKLSLKPTVRYGNYQKLSRFGLEIYHKP